MQHVQTKIFEGETAKVVQAEMNPWLTAMANHIADMKFDMKVTPEGPHHGRWYVVLVAFEMRTGEVEFKRAEKRLANAKKQPKKSRK